MKGNYKCFGLLLALLTIFGLSFVVSSDVDALQYDINTIPIYFPANSTSFPNFFGSPGFRLVTSNDVDSSLLASEYVISLADDNGTCKAVSQGYVKLPLVTVGSSSTSISYGFNGIADNASPFDSVDPCLSISALNDYDSLSVEHLALTDSQLRYDLKSLLPYRFSYDGFYTYDTSVDDGLHRNSKFDLAYLLGLNNYPDQVFQLYIPFGSGQSSVWSNYTNDTPIEFSGEFLIDPADIESSFGLSSSTSIKLETYYLTGSGYSGPDLSDCSWSFSHDDPNDLESIYSLKYTCSTMLRSSSSQSFYDPSSMRPWFRLRVLFDYESENTKFNQFIFDSSLVVTDYDNTPAGDFNESITGSDPEDAPGSASSGFGDISYDNSLVNLFHFNFLNPFAPLFNLFNNSNQCVSIPIIAGMLHAEESTYCPWFSSDVRSVLTPVLSLASVMLIFGFAVRWLGSSSGNLFEDSAKEEVSNQGGKWGHFKKGGN